MLAQKSSLDRKGALSQNVIVVCAFDMRFHFVLLGWEGSAHDSRVLQDGNTNKDFEIPVGKYYLADAGYVNRGCLLTPYRWVRYHLKEQRLAQMKYDLDSETYTSLSVDLQS
jgi:hypothetical protein